MKPAPPVTIVVAGPCVVLQVKRADESDGYNGVQLGFDDVKPHRSTLPEIGHARKAGTAPKRYIREIRLSEPSEEQVGDTVTVGDVEGTVSRIQIRATTVTDSNRKEIVIPNKEFVTGRIINWSLSDQIIRVVVRVGGA